MRGNMENPKEIYEKRKIKKNEAGGENKKSGGKIEK